MTASTDAFAEALSDPRGVALGSSGGGLPNGPEMYKNLRRPVRGIQIKDETHAVIRCITADGHPIPFLDGGSSSEEGDIGESVNYANFLIEGIQERRAEKKQIIETFGEDYILFFGEEPRMLNVSGQLLNTADFDWKNEFWANYESLMRGTRLVDAGARLYFSFDDSVFEGYMTEASTTQTSQDPYKLPVQFQFFVTNHVTTSTIGKMTYQFDNTTPEGLKKGTRGTRLLESEERQASMRKIGNDLTDLLNKDGGNNALALTYSPNGAETQQISLQNYELEAGPVGRLTGGGGLTGVLASVNGFRESLSFKANQTMNNYKNAFYGRTLRLPSGIYVDTPPSLGNEASFGGPARTGERINKQREEYIRSGDVSLGGDLDTKALETLQKMRLKYVADFADKVENDSLALYGVDAAGSWKDTAMFLGPLAWGLQSALIAFGMRQINGNIIDATTQPGAF
jgi:hypothetical protein